MCVCSVKNKSHLFVLFFAFTFASLAVDVNLSLKSSYAIPSASDSLTQKYNYQAGMFADGNATTAWVTGYDMDKHWADIRWKNRRITVNSIEIDFTPLVINYYKKAGEPPRKQKAGLVKIKTQKPVAFELAAKVSERWVIVHSYKDKIKWKSPFVARIHPAKRLQNVSEIKLLFSNTGSDQLYAVREIRVAGPAYETSLTMRPQWKGKATWIWGDKQPILSNYGIVKRYFRKIFQINRAAKIQSAVLLFSAKDRGEVFINGKSVAKTHAIGVGMKSEEIRVDITTRLFRNGKNLLAIVGEDIYEFGGRGIIYQLALKYKDGSSQNICSDLKGRVSSSEEKNWNTSTELFNNWETPNYLAQPNQDSTSMWCLDYTPPYFSGEAEITKITLTPDIPKAGEKYKLEIDVQVDKPLKSAYGIIAEYGFKTPVKEYIINYTLGEDFLKPNKFIEPGFKGVKKVVLTGVWPEGTPSHFPVRIIICNKNNQLNIINGAVGRPTTGAHPGALLFYLGSPALSFKDNDFPETQIDKLGRLKINGEITPPVLYTSAKDNLENFADWRKSGINLYRILPQNTCPIIGTDDNEDLLQEKVLKTIEVTVNAILSVNKNAKFFVMTSLNMPNEWKLNHPEELMLLGDRTRLVYQNFKDKMAGFMQESPNSKAVVRKMRNSLKSFVEKLRKKPYASKIIGLCLYQGRAGENYWGLNINQYLDASGQWVVADRNNFVFGDYGYAFRRHFARFLKEKYKRKEELSKAWKINNMDFSDIVSSRKWPISRFLANLRWKKRPDNKFMFRDRLIEGWLYYDYVRHQNEARAHLFIEAAKVIKKSSAGKLLVGGYIGYSVPNLTNSPPAAAQHSGHLAMRLVRQCHDFDFACSPYFYHSRRQGDPVMPFGTYDSLKLNGKLWMNEFDSRTFLSSASPKTFSLKETRGQLKKEFAFAFTKDQGWWWLQFAGLRGPGWFSDPLLLKDAKIMESEYKKSLSTKNAKSKSEIAVFLNEEQGYYTDAYSPANTTHSNLINFVLPTLQKVGAPHDLFAQADLKKFTDDDYYKHYKLIIFLNAFHLSEEDREAINKLKSDGRTLLFFYAPGYQGNLNNKKSELSLKGIEDVIEMKSVRRLDEMHILGMKTNNSITFNSPGWGGSGQIKRYGQGLGPVFYLKKENQNWESLASLRIDNKDNNDKTALARLRQKNYSIWYSAIPYLPLKELTRIVKASGAHIYCDAGVLVYANDNYIAVHSGKALSNLKINAKSAKDWNEIFEEKSYGNNRQFINIALSKGETKVFRISNPK